MPARVISSGEPALVEFVRETIRQSGPVTFAWFMEQALYHPAHGYYSSGRAAIGRGGDYFTSVSVGPLFGRLLAAQFAEMWEMLGRPEDFTIVEQGAHGGEFAEDVLAAARLENPEFFRATSYVIVEPFAVLEGRQRAKLGDFSERVKWRESLRELAPFRGVHFSNELLDAMPVHLVKWTGAAWLERHVIAFDAGFVFVDLPLSIDRLGERLRNVAQPLPAGYETEVNLTALDWIEELAPRLTAGWILAADYGYTREDFYAPHRPTGTLSCYANHQVLESVFSHIGHSDLTSQVDWSSLAERAAASGLTIEGFTDQHHFITGLLAGGSGEKLLAANDAKTTRALQTLLHPGFLGMKFQFLALAKNIPVHARLSGLRFARQLPGSARL